MKRSSMLGIGLGALIGTGALVKAAEYHKKEKEKKKVNEQDVAALLELLGAVTGSKYIISKDAASGELDKATTDYLRELEIIETGYSVFII